MMVGISAPYLQRLQFSFRADQVASMVNALYLIYDRRLYIAIV